MQPPYPASPRGEVRVHRLAASWKRLFAIVGVSFCALVAGAAREMLKEGHSPAGFLEFTIPFVVFFAVLALTMFYIRLEISEDTVSLFYLFRQQTLPLDAIEGFRIVPAGYITVLRLVPRGRAQRVMIIPLVLERRAELTAWAAGSFENLRMAERQRQLEAIQRDISPGSTPEEKARFYLLARKCCLAIHFISGLAAFWAILYPHPYSAVVWIVAALPFVGLLALHYFKGAVDGPGGGAYLTVAGAFILPAVALGLRAFLDWRVLEWANFWPPFAVLTTVLWLLLFVLAGASRKKGTLVIYAILCMLHAMGAVVCLNGILATAPSTSYPARVVYKYATPGNPPERYLTFGPWKDGKGQGDYRVGSVTYNKYKPGDTAQVYVRKGAFGIPFYYIR